MEAELRRQYTKRASMERKRHDRRYKRSRRKDRQVELLWQPIGLQRARLCCSSLLRRHEQLRLHRTSSNIGWGFYTVIAGLHLLQFPGEVRLLGVKRIDVTSSSDRHLRYRGTQRVPRPRTQAAGCVSDKRSEVHGTLQRAISL